ncbi:hypothetical protein SAMN04489729_6875 [Amycolatopsis lurida]|uniref:hypothetical protein n=1 Tax=Amycolatopsis lurida TaxID=31959 RepID=UPI00089681D0|nr:hypothetical protein [Amycolatopsis lurida]SEE26423.1 hypothetical protein SAMN04489729_6875 [Amycolatopsis lurida]
MTAVDNRNALALTPRGHHEPTNYGFWAAADRFARVAEDEHGQAVRRLRELFRSEHVLRAASLLGRTYVLLLDARCEEVDELSWLVRERATGREWRVDTSEMAWEVGGYDLGRFEIHVIDELVNGAPDGYPDPARE